MAENGRERVAEGYTHTLVLITSRGYLSRKGRVSKQPFTRRLSPLRRMSLCRADDSHDENLRLKSELVPMSICYGSCSHTSDTPAMAPAPNW